MQIAPVVDASSAQSRADVLAIGLSAVTLLIGLQWISLTPRTPVQVRVTSIFFHTHGANCRMMSSTVLHPSLGAAFFSGFLQDLLCWTETLDNSEQLYHDLPVYLQVEPAGSTASFISTALPQSAQAELRWCARHPSSL